jgi:hypothetical protein
MDQYRKVQSERCVRHAPYRRYANPPILASSGHVLKRQRDYLQDHRLFETSVHPETDPFEDSPIAPWRPDAPKPEPNPHPRSGLGARVRPQLAVQSHPIPESARMTEPNTPKPLERGSLGARVRLQPAPQPIRVPDAAPEPPAKVPATSADARPASVPPASATASPAGPEPASGGPSPRRSEPIDFKRC